MFLRGAAEVGLGQAQAQVLAEGRRDREDTFTAWAPLVLVKEGLWLDLLLDADEPSAKAMFQSLLGRHPVSERELLDFLAETFNLLCTAIKGPLAEQGSVVFMPVISRSIRSGALNFRPPETAPATFHRLTLPDITLDITALSQPAPVIRKALGRLCELDTLAENLPFPGSSEVFLLNQGVVLSRRYIEKLSSLAKNENKALRVPVIEPSPLAEFFCLGRIAAG